MKKKLILCTAGSLLFMNTTSIAFADDAAAVRNSSISIPMYIFISLFLLIITAAFYGVRRNIKPEGIRTDIYLPVLLAVGLAVRLIAAPAIEGFSSDVNTFKAWALAAADNLSGFYNTGMFADYPPLYIYVLFLIGKLAGFAGPAVHFTLLIKLPAILADIATAYLLYRMVKKQLNPNWGLLAAAAYVFNPAVFLDSTLWGQVDSFFTLLAVLALLLLMENKVGLSAVFFAALVLMKPQGIIFLPVLFFELLKRRSLKQFVHAALCGAATFILVIAPFSRDPLWVFHLFISTGQEYSYASLNAFNLFSLLGANLKADASVFLFLNYSTWGFILDIAVLGFVAWLYWKGKHNSLPLLAALLLNTGAFVLSSRMHERYLFPAVALAVMVLALTKDRRFWYIFSVLTATVSINILAVLDRMIVTNYPHIPANDMQLKIFSLWNVVMFAYLVKVSFDVIIRNKTSVLLGHDDPAAGTDSLRKNRSLSLNAFGKEPERLRLDGKDAMIMGGMTLVYLVVALINLGSFGVPNTSWQPARPGEYLVLDLGRQVNIARINYYGGLNERKYDGGSYTIEAADDNGSFQPAGTITKNEFYTWKSVDISVKTDKLKITASTPGATLNEIGLFEAGSREPVRGIKISAQSVDPLDKGRVENLVDEQKWVQYSPSYLTGTYFDEIYHARTALEHLKRMEPYESTHPPLGKLLIALGIAVFGMNPFGWRIVGTLFGAAMIPVMYVFGKKLFTGRFYAFCTAFLMMFDFMHFTQTRIATIDVYGTFFIILMYYYMYDYFVNKSYVLGFRQSLKPLLLCGLFFGLGVASKWISLYAAAGLALLFLIVKLEEYRDFRRAQSDKRFSGKAWVREFVPLYLVGTIMCCIVFFIVIPVIIYLLSYIPFMMVPGEGHGLKNVISYQQHMFNYHNNLVATHPFSSPWWSWPLVLKPIWYYGGSELAQGKASSIVAFGNPAIWWGGVVAALSAAVIAWKKRDRRMLVVYTAMLFQYLPWVFVNRLVFIYHFFSTIPFMILTIVYMIRHLMEKDKDARYIVYAYLAVVAVLFMIFYPVLSGMLVDRSYLDGLRWMKDWVF
jgi:dolichyl-phosphate-mannose-protein mannosyltransferase